MKLQLYTELAGTFTVDFNERFPYNIKKYWISKGFDLESVDKYFNKRLYNPTEDMDMTAIIWNKNKSKIKTSLNWYDWTKGGGLASFSTDLKLLNLKDKQNYSILSEDGTTINLYNTAMYEIMSNSLKDGIEIELEKLDASLNGYWLCIDRAKVLHIANNLKDLDRHLLYRTYRRER